MFVSPTVVGNAVILGSCAGTLYALDRMTGTPIWLYDTRADGSAAQFHGEPLLVGDQVVIPTDSDPKGNIYSFDSASGDLLWKVAFNQGVATTPLLIAGRVIAVSAEGEVVAIDPKNGEVAWQEAPNGALKPLPYVPSPAWAAKRIFGRISGMGTLGGLAGGVVAERVAAWISSSGVILVLAILHLACACVLWRSFSRAGPPERIIPRGFIARTSSAFVTSQVATMPCRSWYASSRWPT